MNALEVLIEKGARQVSMPIVDLAKALGVSSDWARRNVPRNMILCRGDRFFIKGVDVLEAAAALSDMALKSRDPHLKGRVARALRVPPGHEFERLIDLRPHVYFVRGADKLKIGWSENPEARIAELRMYSPVPLTIAATAPGDVRDEARLHVAFSDLRSHGEWFFETGRLAAFVGALSAVEPQEARSCLLQYLA